VTEMAICSNVNCTDRTRYEVGTYCTTCGTQITKLGIVETGKIATAKAKLEKAEDKIAKGEASILISENMTDEDITSEIKRDMMNLAMHEAGTGWMRAGSLLSLNPTEQMLGAGFKALIDQNKIIIRQNELILRQLRKTTKA
jgi:hypothetical protein